MRKWRFLLDTGHTLDTCRKNIRSGKREQRRGEAQIYSMLIE